MPWMDLVDDFILGPLDYIDMLWSYIAPAMHGYAPWELEKISVWVDGRGPLEEAARDRGQNPAMAAPSSAASAREVKHHLSAYGVRVWYRGFNARQIHLVVPKSQYRWAMHLANFDRNGYALLRKPRTRWKDRQRGGLAKRILRAVRDGW